MDETFELPRNSVIVRRHPSARSRTAVFDANLPSATSDSDSSATLRLPSRVLPAVVPPSATLSASQGGASRSQADIAFVSAWSPRQVLTSPVGAVRRSRMYVRSLVRSAGEAKGRCVETRPQFW